VIGGGDWAADQIVPGANSWTRRTDRLSQPGRHPALAACAERLSGYLCLAERHSTGMSLVDGFNFGAP